MEKWGYKIENVSSYTKINKYLHELMLIIGGKQTNQLTRHV